MINAVWEAKEKQLSKLQRGSVLGSVSVPDNGGKKMSSIRPLGERIIVKPAPSEEKTAGGLYIPETAKEKPQKGEVIAVGPGHKSEDGEYLPMEVKVGDKVLYGKYSGTELKLDGEVYLIIKESDILAVL